MVFFLERMCFFSLVLFLCVAISFLLPRLAFFLYFLLWKHPLVLDLVKTEDFKACQEFLVLPSSLFD